MRVRVKVALLASALAVTAMRVDKQQVLAAGGSDAQLEQLFETANHEPQINAVPSLNDMLTTDRRLALFASYARDSSIAAT